MLPSFPFSFILQIWLYYLLKYLGLSPFLSTEVLKYLRTTIAYYYVDFFLIKKWGFTTVFYNILSKQANLFFFPWNLHQDLKKSKGTNLFFFTLGTPLSFKQSVFPFLLYFPHLDKYSVYLCNDPKLALHYLRTFSIFFHTLIEFIFDTCLCFSLFSGPPRTKISPWPAACKKPGT